MYYAEFFNRYWLGVALCAKKDILPSLEQLYQGIELYEELREAGIRSGRFQLAMHEQQTLCYQVEYNFCS